MPDDTIQFGTFKRPPGPLEVFLLVYLLMKMSTPCPFNKFINKEGARGSSLASAPTRWRSLQRRDVASGPPFQRRRQQLVKLAHVTAKTERPFLAAGSRVLRLLAGAEPARDSRDWLVSQREVSQGAETESSHKTRTGLEKPWG